MPVQLTTLDAAESTPDPLPCDCYVHLYGAIGAGRRAERYPTDMMDAEWAEVRASMPVPAWLEGRGGRRIPIHEVSRWLGHRSIKTTVDVYGHLIPASWDRCRMIMQNALRPDAPLAMRPGDVQAPLNPADPA